MGGGCYFLVSLSPRHTHATPPASPEKLRELEEKTGQPKAYFALGASVVVLAVLHKVGGMKLVSDLFGFVYPAFASLRAIESKNKDDDTQWLTYWVVFAIISILEHVLGGLMEGIPVYYGLKMSYLAWLFLPKFQGAVFTYKQALK